MAPTKRKQGDEYEKIEYPLDPANLYKIYQDLEKYKKKEDLKARMEAPEGIQELVGIDHIGNEIKISGYIYYKPKSLPPDTPFYTASVLIADLVMDEDGNSLTYTVYGNKDPIYNQIDLETLGENYSIDAWIVHPNFNRG